MFYMKLAKSPFSVPTDALYFSWEELRSMNENDEIEFRCNDGNQIVPLSNNNMLPQVWLEISPRKFRNNHIQGQTH